MMNMPKDWDVVKIGEMYDITKKPKEIVYSHYGYLPFIAMDLIPIGSTYSGNFKLKKSTEISSGTYIENGDILLAKITPCFENGKQCIITGLPNGFGIASTEIIPIKEKTGISSKYFLFYYLLQSNIRTLIAGKMEGATGRQRVPVHLIKELFIPFPSLREQQKIAAILYKIQKAIEIQESIIEKLRELKKSTLHHVFTYCLLGEKSKETEIGPIPESWEVSELYSVLKLAQYGLSVKGLSSGQYPILRMNCQIDGQVHLNDLQYVNLDNDIFEKFKVDDGDILFNRTNSWELVGRTAIYHSKEAAVFASYLIRLKLDEEKTNPDYLTYFFNMDATQNRLKSLASRGVSQSNISASKLKTFQVPIPAMNEQLETVKILRAIDQKIFIHITKKSALQDLFKTMLNKLMTGEIRVKDIDIDISEVSV